MHIFVASALGLGSTELSAFDDALVTIGVADRNLIRLSSVAPPSSRVIPVKTVAQLAGEHGDRLYVVYAEQRSSVTGTWVGAGIGWTLRDDHGGWFVEHEACGTDRASVERSLRALIEDSLVDIVGRRGLGIRGEMPKIDMQLEIGEVTEDPACALVLAVFRNEGWGP